MTNPSQDDVAKVLTDTQRVERLEKTLAQFIEWTDGLGLQGGDMTLLLNMLNAAPEMEGE